MGNVISFPVARPELEELRDFGTVGGVTVSMLREKGREGAPITIALVSDAPGAGLHGVMAFRPEGRAVAEIVGDAVVRTLQAVGLTHSPERIPQIWGVLADQERA